MMRDVSIGGTPQSIAAQPALPNDLPRIQRVWLSGKVIRTGEWWSGQVAGTKNIAAVELRAPSFSFVLHRTDFGEFAFRTHVLSVPSMYRRSFYAEIVARNAAGASDRRTVELEFR